MSDSVVRISKVNEEIAEALALLNKQIKDNPTELAACGVALSAAQALTLAVQDSVDHLRRMQMISEAMAIKALKTGDASGGADGAALVAAAFEQLKQVAELASKTVNFAR